MIRHLAAATLLWTGPAMAEPWDCTFTVECALGEGCAEAAFEMEIIAADHEGQLFASTIFGDTPIMRLTAPGAVPASYAGSGASGLADLVTIEPDRTAVMSVHFVDGETSAVTYLGSCVAF